MIKSQLLTLTAFAAISATTAKADTEFSMTLCKSQLALATKYLQNEKDLSHRGHSGPGRIARAELNLLKVRFDCRDILAKDYCQQSLAVTTAFVKILEDASDKGHIAKNFADEAKFELLKIEVQCR